ncbi:hypothetical protein QJS10_CPA06g01301 [Acorus calamus]|uniref:Reverse transcriptase domain-containing protein n=1 Tax=Acorus calamus TaxID=4465 RepID=A0AAV9EIC2_ACOCL|nr:hypothetical protein QJS10_CPA06g01301 [Acorus calamus]
MVVQECISATHKDGKRGVVIKLDFAKAYDNGRWDFLLHLLTCHGFEANWIRMVRDCISTAKASVLVNGKPCGFFHMNKGLRQGDPLSPILFTVVANAFSRMMKMAEADGWIEGLSTCTGGPSTSHVQYADDTVILCAANSLSIRGAKFVCKCFEFLSGLQINFHKSSMVGIHVALEEIDTFAKIFGCRVQHYPTRLLGLPLHLGKLQKMDWNSLVVKFERRLEGWKGKILSFGGLLTLLQAVLSNLPVFLLSMFKVPEGVLQKLDGIRRRFLWSGANGEGRKAHMVRWDLALLSKWRWRWLSNRGLLWCRHLEAIFGCGDSSNRFPTVSFTWRNILSFTEGFMDAIWWKVGDGRSISFWHDVWLGECTLKEHFPGVYRLSRDRDGTVASFWCHGALNGLGCASSKESSGRRGQIPHRPSGFRIQSFGDHSPDIPSLFEDVMIGDKEIIHEKLLTRVYCSKWVPDADTICPLCMMEEEMVKHLFIGCPILLEGDDWDGGPICFLVRFMGDRETSSFEW